MIACEAVSEDFFCHKRYTRKPSHTSKATTINRTIMSFIYLLIIVSKLMVSLPVDNTECRIIRIAGSEIVIVLLVDTVVYEVNV